MSNPYNIYPLYDLYYIWIIITHGCVEASDGGCDQKAPVETPPPNIPVETMERTVPVVGPSASGSPTLPATPVSGEIPTPTIPAVPGTGSGGIAPMVVDSEVKESDSAQLPVPTPTRAMLAYWSKFKVEKPHTSPMSGSSRTSQVVPSPTPVVGTAQPKVASPGGLHVVPVMPSPTPVVARAPEVETPSAEPNSASPGGPNVDPTNVIAAALNRATTVDLIASPPPVLAKATPPQPPAAVTASAAVTAPAPVPTLDCI